MKSDEDSKPAATLAMKEEDEAYPVRLVRALVRQTNGGGSGVGRPLEHVADADADAEELDGTRPIYLDWNATSQVFPEVALKMLPYLYSRCGNPGSAHAYGQSPRAAVAHARAAVAQAIGAESPDEIVFASCGTEAINWAIRGAIREGWHRWQRGGSWCRSSQKRPHVITTAVEHPAVLALLQHMEDRKEIDLAVVGVSEEGILDLHELRRELRPSTVLVAVMHANNEVGSLQPIVEVAELCRNHDCFLFVDAAQAVGKVPVHVKETLGGADLLSVVGHKFGAPKGVAALYIKKERLALEPMLLGGGQEGGRRSGTESVLLIAGLGEAASIVTRELPALQRHMAACTELLRELLVAELGGEEEGQLLRFNGPADPAHRLPNTLSVSFRGLHGPRLVSALADTVALSAGSACHAHGPSLKASAVLQAMAVPEEYALGTLRISCGRHTTVEEVRRAARMIAAAVREERARVMQASGVGVGDDGLKSEV